MYLVRTEFAVKEFIQILIQTRKFLSAVEEEATRLQFQELFENEPTFTSEWNMGESATLSRIKPFVQWKMKASALRCVQDVCATGLLQIAKQGIALQYQGNWKKDCPLGRQIENEYLRNVIWHGRNQAMHYEEELLPFKKDPTKEEKKKPKYKQQEDMIKCFSNLGTNFSLINNPKVCLARKVVELLGWDSYENFRGDLQSLLMPESSVREVGASPK
ncbi:MAG: hypothetical protein HY043_15735 [Verrucomicrobia bacterium]|nr:hypothetical protein [Verrucomicrobiota bacterium]